MTVSPEDLASLRRLRRALPPRRVELAEPSSAWEKILARIPASQRRLAKVDDAAAARIIQAYQQARVELMADLDRRWAMTFGAHVEPTIDQRVRFMSSIENLQQLEARQRDLAGGTIAGITHAYDGGVLEALRQNSAERDIMASNFPVLQHMDPFTPPPSTVEEIYVNKAVQDASHIAAATRDQASLALATAALRGEGIDAMRKRLTPVFDGNARRAELTARYVSIKAYNEASKINYGQMQNVLTPYGRTIHKMWIATRDDRSCPICLALHGTLVGLEENFDLTATFDTKPPPKSWPEADRLEEPPRHTRCRCTIGPWVDGWQHGTRHTPQAMQAEARSLAVKAGYAPPQRVFRGSAPPAPLGPRLTATQVRQVPREAYLASKARYLECVYPKKGLSGSALLSAHGRGPAAFL